ncbi:MAG: VWA domain-containing protein [Planctomycetes bacterium]|nr:VWA domain-containing protein [Planctomycetota bacterium]
MRAAGGRGVSPGQPSAAPMDSLSAAADKDAKMKGALNSIQGRRSSGTVIGEQIVDGESLGFFVEGAAPAREYDRYAYGITEGGSGGIPADDYSETVQRYYADVVDRAGGAADAPMDGYREDDDTWTPWSLQENTLPSGESLFGTEADSFASQALSHTNAEISLANEAYSKIVDNTFNVVTEQPLSTFSIDVDTASYSNIRRIINSNSMIPPAPAVRIEEMVNYFDYKYTPPAEDDPLPFATAVEIAECPWEPSHKLARIGLKGKEIAANNRPATNLVFLLDVSGSMSDRNKLPLVKKSMAEMVNNLTVDDRVAIVTYAGNSQVALESTPCFQRQTILDAINRLSAGGSTNGAAGITQAYDIASANFIKEGVNRVVLATDGDFNVGISNNGDLLELIDEKADTGVFLSVLGFGMGNYKDDKLETLADHGNGNYAYIDTYDEAYHVLVEKMAGTLVTIAKDVKIQIEFNPARVASYRLIGYENRVLAARDFNDDTIDAGEIGAGHTVTALYEIVPAAGGSESGAVVDDPAATEPATDDLVYQKSEPTDRALASSELFNLKLRYKEPAGDESKLVVIPVSDSDGNGISIDDASPDFRFAAAVASYGMLLRNSPYAGKSTFGLVLELAASAGREESVDRVRLARGGEQRGGAPAEAEADETSEVRRPEAVDADATRRAEFVELVRRTIQLTDTGDGDVNEQ